MMEGNFKMTRYKPKVSIIIPFYNCRFVDRAIKSALQQTYSNCEIIVVDDGSTIHKDLINPYLDKVRYLRKVNGGTASALNAGLNNATGEYFSWLSSDDMYHPEKVEKQIDFMLKHGAVISYGNYQLMNERDHITSDPVGVNIPDKYRFIRAMRSGCIINGCTVMANIEVIKRAGLFDETLPFTHDYDLWLRLLLVHDFYYFPEPLVLYRIHGSMGSRVHKAAIALEIRKVKKRYRDQISRLVNLNSPRRHGKNFK
ncbi:glycosyltransferase [Bacillus sp. Marseille-Q3570]|uniref:glycosyltransferase n=1 Tax=Bacillus sp. Marseille-Q3570 TaxID=2963522 RepID=UPI0021B72ED1|nr:glycosyltransferase [Bacillus sp. Marseille-Q3570]